MTTETEVRPEPENCPTCKRELLASAHDAHLFCPECGFNPPRQVDKVDDGGR